MGKDIVDSVLKLLEKYKNKENKKFDTYVNSTYSMVKEITADLLEIIMESEQLLKEEATPHEVIDKLKLERNNLFVERHYIKQLLTSVYYENKNLREFVYGISTILNGGDLKSYTQIRANEPPIMGHALLDIIDHYESICLFAQNDETIIKNELLRVFDMQKQFIMNGFDITTKAYVQLLNQRI